MDKEQAFKNESEELFRNRCRVLALYVAAPVYFSYLAVDLLLSPENISKFAVIRSLVCLLIIYGNHLIQNKKISTFWGAILVSVPMAFSISFMGFLSAVDLRIPYLLSGSSTVLLGVLFFLPWQNKFHFLLTSVLVSTSYYLVRPFIDPSLAISELVTKIGFDLTVVSIALSTNEGLLTYRRREYESRLNLNEAIQQRERIIRQQVEELRKSEKESENMKIMADLAAQVAHDVRSPLTALNLVMTDLSALPEEKRSLVRLAVVRINDIANNLLSFRRNLNAKTDVRSIFRSSVENVISEMRIIGGRREISFRFDFTDSYPPTFFKDEREFARAFSNFLQNAVDASPTKSEIHVKAERDGKFIRILIKDQGAGFPPDIIDDLGKRPITKGKVQGNGLGVFNSCKSIVQLGGKVSLRNNSGAEVDILLPTTEPPSWIARAIDLSSCQRAVVIDDDQSIHEVWKARLEGRVATKHFFSLREAERWMTEGMKDSIFLVDYEFENEDQVGSSFIEKYRIQKTSFLVTSRYDDDKIVQDCLKAGVQIIPKGFAGVIPLTL